MKNKYPALSILALMITSFSFYGCNNNCKEPSGTVKSEQRPIGDFSKIELSGNVKLNLKQGSSQSLSIQADENVLADFLTEVSGSTLTLKTKENYCDANDILVNLTLKNLDELTASGATEITSDGRIKTGDFAIILSGSSNLKLNLEAQRVSTTANGSSDITLTGQAGEHEVDMSGSGSLQAFDFVVGDYKIQSSGSNKCEINVLNQLDVSSSGSSEVFYKGNPKKVSNDNSGSAKVEKVN